MGHNKKKEKNLDSYTAMLEDVPHYLPALMRSEKIQKKAGSVGFDWEETEPIYDKISEEMTEVKEAVKNGRKHNSNNVFIICKAPFLLIMYSVYKK